MTNRIDLLATTTRIRQNMVWQTVIAAEKAAIAVFAAKNAKGKVTVLADDADPLKSIDAFKHTERLDPSAIINTNFDKAEAALLPYTNPVRMDRAQFVALVDRMLAKSGDKLFAGVNPTDAKALLFQLASQRLEIAKLREHLTDRTYLSAVGFDTALAMFETADEQMRGYNALLRHDVIKLGINTKALSKTQGRLSAHKAKEMLQQEQAKLRHMLNLVEDGKSIENFPNREVVRDFLAKHKSELAEYTAAQTVIAEELRRRNKPNVQTIHWEKIPEDIKAAAAKITELRQFVDRRTLDAGNTLYESQQQLEDKLAHNKALLIEKFQPADDPWITALSDGEREEWFHDLLMNPPANLDPALRQLVEETNDLDEQLLAIDEALETQEKSQSYEGGTTVPALSPETVDRNEELRYVKDSLAPEDTALHQQILQYREDLFRYLRDTFDVSLDELDKLDDLHHYENLLDVFKRQNKVVVSEPVVVTLDGETHTLETNEELETMLERVRSFLNLANAGLGKTAQIKREMIDMQTAHVDELKEAVALLDVKNLFGSLKMNNEELGLFKFVKAAVIAEKERRLQVAKNPDVLENTDPDISFAMYGGKDHADNVAIDTRPLVNAYQNASFADFDYVAPQLHNIVLDPLRQTRGDFDLFESTPIDELLKRISEHTAAKLGVKQRLLNQAEEQLRKAEAFNQMATGGLTYDQMQLNTAQKQALLDLLEDNIDKLDSALTTEMALPIPDLQQVHPFVPFVQGMKAAVAFNKVKVGDVETIQVELIDFQAAPLPLDVQMEDTFQTNTALSLFVEYNPYEALPNPLDALQKERQLVRLPHAASMALAAFVEQADDFWDKEYERLHRLAENTEFPGPLWRPMKSGEKKLRMFYYRYNPEDGQNYVFRPPRQEPERTLTPPVPEQVEEPTVTDVTAPVESQPMPEPEPVPSVVSQPEPVSQPVPSKPVEPTVTRNTDAKGNKLAKGDKVKIGGLQDGTVMKVTEAGVYLSVVVGKNPDGSDRSESRMLTWSDVDTDRVVRLGLAESKVVPLSGEPIPNMKPAYLNPNVLVMLQSAGQDVALFVGVDFSKPENALLRDQLIRMVLAYIDANQGDPDARKLLACIPLKTEKGNLSPALIDKLVAAGNKRDDVLRMSEDSARSLLIHTKFSPSKLDESLKTQLRDLGWTDADIAGMEAIDAFRYLANKTRKPESTQDAEIKAQMFAEVTLANPGLLLNVRTQASAVEMRSAMRRTANHLRGEIQLAKTVQLMDTSTNQRLVEQLHRDVDALGAALRSTTGDVGRVKDEPGLSKQESAYKGALITALGALRAAQRRYQTMLQTDRNPDISKFVKQVQVDIDRYQTELNGLDQKSKAFTAKKSLDEYVANPENKALRVGLPLPTLEQFEDRPPTGFSKPSMDSLNIVPMDRSPDELVVNLGPAPKAAPKTVKPGRSSNGKPATKYQKNGRKPNLKPGKTMKLDDFLKQKR